MDRLRKRQNFRTLPRRTTREFSDVQHIYTNHKKNSSILVAVEVPGMVPFACFEYGTIFGIKSPITYMDYKDETLHRETR